MEQASTERKDGERTPCPAEHVVETWVEMRVTPAAIAGLPYPTSSRITTSEIGLSIPTPSVRSENHPARAVMEYPESDTSPGTTSAEVVLTAFASVVLHGPARVPAQRR